MKLSNIFTIGLAALTLSACSSYDPHESVSSIKLNSASGVVVSMEDTELQFPEDRVSSATYYNIPVVVTGNPNGAVKVQVNISATSESPATEGENFIVTSKTIYVSPDSHVANVEFYPVGDRVINDDRQFVVTIEKAEGAEIGTASSTLVSLLDNDLIISQLYPTIEGDWIWSYEGDLGANEDAVYFNTFEEGTPEYDNREFQIIGYMGNQNSAFKATFDYDAVSQQAVIAVPLGQYVMTTSFTGLGAMDVYTGYYTGSSWDDKGPVLAYSNRTSDNIIRFSFSQAIWLGIANPGTTAIQYLWAETTSNKIVRP